MPCASRLAPQPTLPSRAPLKHSDTLGYGAHDVHAVHGAHDGHAAHGAYGNGGLANGFTSKVPTMHRMPTGHLAPPSPIAEERDGSLESGKTGSSNLNGMLRGS